MAATRRGLHASDNETSLTFAQKIASAETAGDQGWCKMVKLRGNYGSHALRKTFGYHQRVTFGVGLPELMVVYNHSSQKQMLYYLCVQADEVRSVHENAL